MADACEHPETEVRLEWAERWLSPSRLSSYLNLCGGDVELALELHEWNLMLGRALMGDIAHFELALRNAYDRPSPSASKATSTGSSTRGSPRDAPHHAKKSKAKKLRDVNMVNRRAIDDARGRAHDPANPNQVIAGLMLGFWAHMTDRSRERDLWIPYLHAAWPAGTDRAKLNLQLEAINKLRNRVAHSERLFNPRPDGCSPARVDAVMLALFRALSPEAYEGLYGNEGKTTIERFLDDHPSP